MTQAEPACRAMRSNNMNRKNNGIKTIRDLWNWAVENGIEDCRIAIPDTGWFPDGHPDDRWEKDCDTMVSGDPLTAEYITDENEYFCTTEGKPYIRLIP